MSTPQPGGRVAVVTGASSGIGEATARVLAAAQRVRDELGSGDILVNSAGVMLLGPFSTELSDDYRRMIETNLLGAITTTEVFLDQLLDGGGDLVNRSSVAGRTARTGNAVYAATKWG